MAGSDDHFDFNRVGVMVQWWMVNGCSDGGPDEAQLLDRLAETRWHGAVDAVADILHPFITQIMSVRMKMVVVAVMRFDDGDGAFVTGVVDWTQRADTALIPTGISGRKRKWERKWERWMSVGLTGVKQPGVDVIPR